MSSDSKVEHVQADQKFYTSFFDSTKPRKTESLRNLTIIAHVDHGKSTLTDNLLAQVGLINEKLAGRQLATDCYQEQKKRGITINSTTVSFYYKDYVFNIMDSPGHVEFNAEVVKSLRGSDGAVLVVDIMDGVMTQTETVLAQALNEGVDIVLFINKVDRIINEQMMDSSEVFKRMANTVQRINDLIKKLTDVEEEYFEFNRNIVFGSALNKWGCSVPYLMSNNKSFKQIVDKVVYKHTDYSEYNLAQILLDTCLKNIKDPSKKQTLKIKNTYQKVLGVQVVGNQYVDENDNTCQIPIGVLNCDISSDYVGIVTDVNYDKHLGLLTTVRALSGVYKKKDPVYSTCNDYNCPLKGPTRIMVNSIKKYYDVQNSFAGSLVTFQGVDYLQVGDTITNSPILKYVYPAMKYSRNPVVSYSLTPAKGESLIKMINTIKLLVKEDPSLYYQYDQQRNEFLLYGVGILHLDVSISKLKLCYGVCVQTSSPLISYAQSLRSGYVSPTVPVRTPNKLNDFEMYIFKLPQQLTGRLLKSQVTNKNLRTECESTGLSTLGKQAVKILKNGCIYFNATKGCSFMDQTKDNLTAAMELSMSTGFQMKKPLKGIGFVLTYAKIHEDGLHRGVTQFRSAFRKGLDTIFETKPPSIVEPIMKATVEAPHAFMAQISNEINAKRGVLEVTQDSPICGYFKGTYKIPLAECLNITPNLMSITEGRVIFDMDLYGYEQISPSQRERIKDQLR